MYRLEIVLGMAIVLTGTDLHAQSESIYERGWPPVQRTGRVSKTRLLEGPGQLRTRRLVLHPGLLLEGGYDSNPMLGEQGPGSASIRIVPNVRLTVLEDPERQEPRKAVVDVGAAPGFQLYPSDHMRKLHMVLDSGLALRLSPWEVLSFEVTDDLLWTPRNEETTLHALRLDNQAAVGIDVHPSSRLSLGLEYGFDLSMFDNPTLAGWNKYSHRFGVEVTIHEPIPYVDIWLQAAEELITYYDMHTGPFTNGYSNSDAKPLRVWAGALAHLPFGGYAALDLGYGNGFHDEGSSYSGPLARVELGYRLDQRDAIRAGYAHSFQDSLQSNYLVDDIVYAALDYQVLRLLMHLRGDYRYRQNKGWEGHSPGSPPTALSKHMVTLRLGLDLRVKPWFYLGLAYDLELDILAHGPMMSPFGGIPYWKEYSRHQVHGRMGVSY